MWHVTSSDHIQRKPRYISIYIYRSIWRIRKTIQKLYKDHRVAIYLGPGCPRSWGIYQFLSSTTGLLLWVLGYLWLSLGTNGACKRQTQKNVEKQGAVGTPGKTQFLDRSFWVFPKIMGKPPNHPFVHRVFHYFHRPFWGPTPIFGLTPISMSLSNTRSSIMNPVHLVVGWWVSPTPPHFGLKNTLVNKSSRML